MGLQLFSRAFFFFLRKTFLPIFFLKKNIFSFTIEDAYWCEVFQKLFGFTDIRKELKMQTQANWMKSMICVSQYPPPPRPP